MAAAATAAARVSVVEELGAGLLSRDVTPMQLCPPPVHTVYGDPDGGGGGHRPRGVGYSSVSLGGRKQHFEVFALLLSAVNR